MKRAMVIVLDSVGCGKAPDADAYGDAGADTLGHLVARMPDIELPHQASVALRQVFGLESATATVDGASHARHTEQSASKDTTTGHGELMGLALDEPFATFKAFPDDLVADLE